MKSNFLSKSTEWKWNEGWGVLYGGALYRGETKQTVPQPGDLVIKVNIDSDTLC